MGDGGLGGGVDERALLEALFQGPMLVVLLDARGRVASLNEAAVRAWGLPPDLRTAGLPVWELLGRPDAERPILQMMDAVRTDAQTFTYRSHWRRPNGEEIFTQWQGGVLRDDEGDVAHFYGLGVDVTERERDAHALAESEDRFRWLASVTNEGIAIHDRGRLVDVNARCRAMFGMAPDDPPPGDVRPFLTPASWRRVTEAARSGGEEPYEVVGRRVNGEEFPLEITPHAIEMRGRRVRVAACRDLSHQKAAEAERARFEEGTRRAERLETLGVLAGGLAHDFNNLLGLIVSYTDLAVDSLPPDSPARADLEEVLDAARRASQIAQQLLLFRPDGTASGEVVSLREAAAAVHRLVARSLAPRVTLELVRGQGTQRVRAASARLEQALVNLVFNARDAVEGPGRITLTTESVTLEAPVPAVDGAIEPGRWAVVRVEDRGTGMAPEVVERAFEPFFTTKSGSLSEDLAEGGGPRGRGTGLGLSMVYGVVVEAGGHIQLVTAVGRGTTISLYFPEVIEVGDGDKGGEKDQDTAPVARAAPSPQRSRDLGRGRTVLVVDDNPHILAVTARILRRFGFRALGAESAREAHHRWEHAQVDLLLTDVLMPDVPGPELAQELRELDPTLRVLFMSGHARDALHGACGGDALLNKPFRAQTLLAAVADALGLPNSRA